MSGLVMGAEPVGWGQHASLTSQLRLKRNERLLALATVVTAAAAEAAAALGL